MWRRRRPAAPDFPHFLRYKVTEELFVLLAGHQSEQQLTEHADESEAEVDFEDLAVEVVLRGQELLRDQHREAEVGRDREEEREHREKLELEQRARHELRVAQLEQLLRFKLIINRSTFEIRNLLFGLRTRSSGRTSS